MDVRMSFKSRQFDATLMPTMDFRSHSLALEYRIRLVRLEPTTRLPDIYKLKFRGDGIMRDLRETNANRIFNLDAWTNAEWMGYSTNLARQIKNYWDDKFELTPSRAWFRASSQHQISAQPIKCYLNVSVVNSSAKAHHTYYIIKPQRTDFRSFVWLSERLGVFTHRDLAKASYIRNTSVGPPDINGQRSVHNIEFAQTTILHEFGHTLGLNHVLGIGNEERRYGVEVSERDDVMGMGEHLHERAARPWISQLGRHLIPEQADRARGVAKLTFSGRVIAQQKISYWNHNLTPAQNTRARQAIDYPKINI